MIIVTHPTTCSQHSIVSGLCYCVVVVVFVFVFWSGTHGRGVSKQLCVYHLYRNVFLAQTRI